MDKGSGINNNTNELFARKVGKSDKDFSWKYAGYITFVAIKEFFTGKTRPKRGHDTFTGTAEALVANLNGENISNELLQSTKELLRQQRMLEDTHARRRLERWATRVISWYLIIVLILVILNGVISVKYDIDGGFISAGIMTVILTTTTINIIGLGLIVLKGHFHPKEKETGDSDK